MSSPNSPKKRALAADKKVAITLYNLKAQESLIMTADIFRIAINTHHVWSLKVVSPLINTWGQNTFKKQDHCGNANKSV